MIWPARVLGVLTVLYGLAVIVKPRLMATPTGVGEPDGSASRPAAILTRAVGVRDMAIGLAMVFAPAGAALYVALAVRIASDMSDAAIFGLSPGDPKTRMKVVVVAGVYGLLNVGALILATRH